MKSDLSQQVMANLQTLARRLHNQGIERVPLEIADVICRAIKKEFGELRPTTFVRYVATCVHDDMAFAALLNMMREEANSL